MGYEMDVLETPLRFRKKVGGAVLQLLIQVGLLPKPIPAPFSSE